jgi:DNA-binding XRE family transcriptional regulator
MNVVCIMISRQQLHIARLSLDMSVNALAKLAGVAPNTVWAIEQGADYKQSSMAALESALRDRGVLFAGPHVGVKMVWADGTRPASVEVREAVLAVLNASRKAKGQAPFVDLEGD